MQSIGGDFGRTEPSSGVRAARAGSIPRFSPWVPGLCACVLDVCACGGVRPRYGAFRDYSDSFVCVEFSQRGRPKILHDTPMLLDAFKKKYNA